MTFTLPTPPHSLEAEKTVLGALLLDPDAIHKVRGKLEPKDFYDPIYSDIYSACIKLCDERKPIDFSTVAQALEGNAKITALGGSSLLANMAADVPTSSHVTQYAARVSEDSRKRDLIRVGQEITALGYDRESELGHLIGQAQELTLKVKHSESDSTKASLGDLSQKNYERVRELEEGGVGDLEQRFFTGFPGLDHIFEGLRPQDMTVIAGRPGMGKTAFMLSLALEAAKKGKHVLFQSLEMSNRSLSERLDSGAIGVTMKEMDRGELDDEQLQKYREIVGSFRNLPLMFDEDPNSALSNLRSKASRHSLEDGLDILFIDYMQLIEPPREAGVRYSNRVEQMSKISRGLKQLARELNIVLIVGCQVNRAVELRPDKRPILSDLRESGSIEQDSDNVMMLHSEAYFDSDIDESDSDVREVWVRKHRQGKTGMVKLLFKKSETKFVEIDRTRSEAPAMQL